MRDPYKLRQTRFAPIAYARISPREWSFFAVDADPLGHRVGPLYRSHDEMLGDLTRYARDSWGLES